MLVNGKRRHRSSIIDWHGGNGVAFGSQGPDISAIPAIALRHVEVLRDGAAAQYGSDAIAGVLNFQLKDGDGGGNASLGPDTPTEFNLGSNRQRGIGLNADLSYAATDMINIAAGAEWRNEQYRTHHGRSRVVDGRGQGFSAGSNGFFGYGPNGRGHLKPAQRRPLTATSS